MTTSTELLENVIHDINDFTYNHNQKYNFNSKMTLFNALTNYNVSIHDIMKWELQLADCIKYEYIHKQDCPEFIDPRHILIDGNGDVIYHTVVFCKQYGTVRNSIRYMDCLIRIHCTLFSCIKEYGIYSTMNNELKIFHILGKFFYAAISSTSYECNVLTIHEFIEQMNNMVKLGLFKDLLQVVPK